MKLIREWHSLCENGLCQDFLTEAEKYDRSQNGSMYLTGKFGVAEEKNGNNRVYPRKILEREVSTYQRIIKESRACGELDHPDSEVVNLKNASHMVTDLWWDGNDLMGKMKVLSGVPGQQLQSLVNDGVQIGVSSRALGSLNESTNGPSVVQEDLILICFDIVSEPSAGGAFVHPVAINESVVRRVRSMYSKSYRIDRRLNEIVGKL